MFVSGLLSADTLSITVPFALIASSLDRYRSVPDYNALLPGTDCYSHLEPLRNYKLGALLSRTPCATRTSPILSSIRDYQRPPARKAPVRLFLGSALDRKLRGSALRYAPQDSHYHPGRAYRLQTRLPQVEGQFVPKTFQSHRLYQPPA